MSSSAIRRLPPLIFPAEARHTASVIFAHGLGDSGHGWADAVENWRRRERLDHCKFIVPHAPMIPITCNGGMKMPGWYDIAAITGRSEDLRANQDEAGTLLSRDYFRELVQQEITAGIPADRIVLSGFSQGGAMALFSALTSPVKLAGVVGLSSYLPLDSKMATFLAENDLNKDTPVLMCHGSHDPVVPTAFGQMSAEMLKALGFKVTMKMYPMAHSACPEELDEVEEFLTKQLPAKDDGKSEL